MDSNINYDEHFVDESTNNYILQTVDSNTILKELNISDEDTALTKSIIDTIEYEISNAIKKGLAASLPNVGVLQKDILRMKMSARKNEVQAARASMTKEEYKEYIKELRRTLKNEIQEEQHRRKRIRKIKQSYGKKYLEMVVNRGKAYADLYVESRFWFKTVEYNQEIQDQYDRIAGRYVD